MERQKIQNSQHNTEDWRTDITQLQDLTIKANQNSVVLAKERVTQINGTEYSEPRNRSMQTHLTDHWQKNKKSNSVHKVY